MLLRCLAVFALVMVAAAPVRADVAVLPDPDKWIAQGLKDITQGKTDDFARDFLVLIDKPSLFDEFAKKLRVLGQLGAPAFMEKVSDVKFGTALREVIYLALYHRTEYVYFRFIIKKNVGGWLISDFSFRSEASELFPKDFATIK